MADVQDPRFAASYGEFIRAGRLKKNLYQKDVAEHLDITQAYYSCLDLTHSHQQQKPHPGRQPRRKA